MGCDIHMYVEYKKEFKSENDSKWVSGDYFKVNPYKDIFDDESSMEKLELFGHRNYALFSTLAGVRDYSEQITPVSEPKGIPSDCCKYIKSEYDRWGIDGHTHSWLTLKELKKYQDSSPVLIETGLISPEAALKLDKDGTRPNAWCQDTSLDGWVRRTWETPNEELIPLIELLQKRAKELMQYDWQEYNTSNDEKIRIVFWFDN